MDENIKKYGYPPSYDDINAYRRKEFMAKSDEILSEVRELKHWLYGKNGFEGDIPDIKKRISALELERKISKKTIAGIASGIAAIAVALWKAFNGG